MSVRANFDDDGWIRQGTIGKRELGPTLHPLERTYHGSNINNGAKESGNVLSKDGSYENNGGDEYARLLALMREINKNEELHQPSEIKDVNSTKIKTRDDDFEKYGKFTEDDLSETWDMFASSSAHALNDSIMDATCEMIERTYGKIIAKIHGNLVETMLSIESPDASDIMYGVELRDPFLEITSTLDSETIRKKLLPKMGEIGAWISTMTNYRKWEVDEEFQGASNFDGSAYFPEHVAYFSSLRGTKRDEAIAQMRRQSEAVKENGLKCIIPLIRATWEHYKYTILYSRCYRLCQAARLTTESWREYHGWDSNIEMAKILNEREILDTNKNDDGDDDDEYDNVPVSLTVRFQIEHCLIALEDSYKKTIDKFYLLALVSSGVLIFNDGQSLSNIGSRIGRSEREIEDILKECDIELLRTDVRSESTNCFPQRELVAGFCNSESREYEAEYSASVNVFLCASQYAMLLEFTTLVCNAYDEVMDTIVLEDYSSTMNREPGESKISPLFNIRDRTSEERFEIVSYVLFLIKALLSKGLLSPFGTGNDFVAKTDDGSGDDGTDSDHDGSGEAVPVKFVGGRFKSLLINRTNLVEDERDIKDAVANAYEELTNGIKDSIKPHYGRKPSLSQLLSGSFEYNNRRNADDPEFLDFYDYEIVVLNEVVRSLFTQPSNVRLEDADVPIGLQVCNLFYSQESGESLDEEETIVKMMITLSKLLTDGNYRRQAANMGFSNFSESNPKSFFYTEKTNLPNGKVKLDSLHQLATLLLLVKFKNYCTDAVEDGRSNTNVVSELLKSIENDFLEIRNVETGGYGDVGKWQNIVAKKQEVISYFLEIWKRETNNETVATLIQYLNESETKTTKRNIMAFRKNPGLGSLAGYSSDKLWWNRHEKGRSAAMALGLTYNGSPEGNDGNDGNEGNEGKKDCNRAVDYCLNGLMPKLKVLGYGMIPVGLSFFGANFSASVVKPALQGAVANYVYPTVTAVSGFVGEKVAQMWKQDPLWKNIAIPKTTNATSPLTGEVGSNGNTTSVRSDSLTKCVLQEADMVKFDMSYLNKNTSDTIKMPIILPKRGCLGSDFTDAEFSEVIDGTKRTYQGNYHYYAGVLEVCSNMSKVIVNSLHDSSLYAGRRRSGNANNDDGKNATTTGTANEIIKSVEETVSAIIVTFTKILELNYGIFSMPGCEDDNFNRKLDVRYVEGIGLTLPTLSGFYLTLNRLGAIEIFNMDNKDANEALLALRDVYATFYIEENREAHINAWLLSETKKYADSLKYDRNGKMEYNGLDRSVHARLSFPQANPTFDPRPGYPVEMDPLKIIHPADKMMLETAARSGNGLLSMTRVLGFSRSTKLSFLVTVGDIVSAYQNNTLGGYLHHIYNNVASMVCSKVAVEALDYVLNWKLYHSEKSTGTYRSKGYLRLKGTMVARVDQLYRNFATYYLQASYFMPTSAHSILAVQTGAMLASQWHQPAPLSSTLAILSGGFVLINSYRALRTCWSKQRRTNAFYGELSSIAGNLGSMYTFNGSSGYSNFTASFFGDKMLHNLLLCANVMDVVCANDGMMPLGVHSWLNISLHFMSLFALNLSEKISDVSLGCQELIEIDRVMSELKKEYVHLSSDVQGYSVREVSLNANRIKELIEALGRYESLKIQQLQRLGFVESPVESKNTKIIKPWLLDRLSNRLIKLVLRPNIKETTKDYEDRRMASYAWAFSHFLSASSYVLSACVIAHSVSQVVSPARVETAMGAITHTDLTRGPSEGGDAFVRTIKEFSIRGATTANVVDNWFANFLFGNWGYFVVPNNDVINLSGVAQGIYDVAVTSLGLSDVVDDGSTALSVYWEIVKKAPTFGTLGLLYELSVPVRIAIMGYNAAVNTKKILSEGRKTLIGMMLEAGELSADDVSTIEK